MGSGKLSCLSNKLTFFFPKKCVLKRQDGKRPTPLTADSQPQAAPRPRELESCIHWVFIYFFHFQTISISMVDSTEMNSLCISWNSVWFWKIYQSHVIIRSILFISSYFWPKLFQSTYYFFNSYYIHMVGSKFKNYKSMWINFLGVL